MLTDNQRKRIENCCGRQWTEVFEYYIQLLQEHEKKNRPDGGTSKATEECSDSELQEYINSFIERCQELCKA